VPLYQRFHFSGPLRAIGRMQNHRLGPLIAGAPADDASVIEKKRRKASLTAVSEDRDSRGKADLRSDAEVLHGHVSAVGRTQFRIRWEDALRLVGEAMAGDENRAELGAHRGDDRFALDGEDFRFGRAHAKPTEVIQFELVCVFHPSPGNSQIAFGFRSEGISFHNRTGRRHLLLLPFSSAF
jgi:hypothetical protein